MFGHFVVGRSISCTQGPGVDTVHVMSPMLRCHAVCSHRGQTTKSKMIFSALKKTTDVLKTELGDTVHNGVEGTVPQTRINRIPQKRGIRRRGVVRQQTGRDDSERSPTAYDVSRRIQENLTKSTADEDASGDTSRRYAGPVDSKGYRILKNQVDDVMTMPSVMLTRLLHDSIIYNKGDVIAIDKPYGLPSHGGPGVHMSVGQLLPALAKLVDPTGQLDTLHLVHRLDRQTTGVMLLAKTAEMAWKLKSAFKKREVVKKYWVLTKGVPSPPKAVVDIPMAEGTVGRFHRMVLKPESTPDTRLVSKRSFTESYQAITEFEVLDSHGNAALVECTPLTGLKHQIRVHLAFGLNTPVLGDHKYSHITKVAPQRLHPDLLHRLGIRQSKVRHLPMLLHAKSILIPGFLDGRNLSIQTRLPRHFSLNMNRLKIKPPKSR
ncbi:pseudouridylate synthase RPUSD4, mitochondrial-like isoform X2 [Haliotis asinina]|uniref:pseudouridylate synthase RPUSD4, mitochondrial-like isoform X2 n=1 Tax=Haliotis asinina TaxID=109174 RepID=UPI00353229C7